MEGTILCVKHMKTLHCIVQCGTPAELAREWNTLEEASERYSEQILDGLVGRFEPPDSCNQWVIPN